MKPWIIAIALSLGWASSVRAQIAVYDAGTAGNPPLAPDPVVQGWTEVDPSGGAVTVAGVSPDGTSGLNAWKVDDAVSFAGGRLHYARLFTPQEILDAAAGGWMLDVRMRLVSAPSLSIFFEYATGQSASDDRYLLFFSVSGPDVVATDLATGTTYTCAGAMDGAYHQFAIRKAPGVAVVDAEFSYDGVSLGTLPRAPSNGNAPAGGVHWGSGSSAGQGWAHFHRVSFELASQPIGQPTFTDVFASGDGLYHTYRIPSVLTTRAGTVLAFAEGRAKAGDHAENDIVMRRSTDGGETWGPVSVLHDDGKNSLNNPCAVQVRTGSHRDRILLMYQRYPEGCHESCVIAGYVGPKVCRGLVMHSDDDGLTWSAPREITTEVKRPVTATSIASGPGVGIQKRRAPNRGRLIVPFNQGPSGAWKVYAVYSDDGGDSWAWGAVADDSQTPGTGNEVQMVELVDGRLYLNSRSAGGTKHRKIATSADAGLSWNPLADELQLVEPQVMASALRYTDPLDGFAQSRILYAGPDSQTARVDGTIHVSYDEAVTWPVSKLLYPGSYAYSVLTVLPDGTIGCLFERSNYGYVTFARFTLEWLTNGGDCLMPSTYSTTYCTSKVNSLGCVPSIASSGVPSSTSPCPFLVRGSSVRNQKAGILLHGTSGPSAVPFQGGTLCLQAPIRRSVGTHSGGNPSPASDCSGVYSIDMNAFAAGALGGHPIPELGIPGTVVRCQWWGRDPGFPPPANTTLTDALAYTVLP